MAIYQNPSIALGVRKLSRAWNQRHSVEPLATVTSAEWSVAILTSLPRLVCAQDGGDAL